MNDEFNKKRNKPSIIGKIFASLGILFVIFIIFIITSYTVHFDGNWNTVIMKICFILLSITLIMLLWNRSHIKIDLTIIVLSIVILVANTFYYENYSMKIEPMLYLHNKYKFDISDMKIIKSTKSTRGDVFGQGGTCRSSTIKYKEYNIYVYYSINIQGFYHKRGWKDDYNEQIRYNEKKQTNS